MNQNYTTTLPDFNNTISTPVNTVVSTPVKQMSGLKKRLIIYPIAIAFSVILGHGVGTSLAMMDNTKPIVSDFEWSVVG